VGWFALYSQKLTVYCFGLFAVRWLVCSIFQKADCLLFLFVCAVRQEYTPDDAYTSYYRPLLPSCSYCSDEDMGSDSDQEARQEVRTVEQQKLQTPPEAEGNHTLRRHAIAMSHSPQVHPYPHL
jgi:hypothetical protein